MSSTEDTPVAAPPAQAERIDISSGIIIEPTFREAYHASLATLAAEIATMDEAEKRARIRAELDFVVKALGVALPLASALFPAIAPFAPAALGGVEALVKAIEG